MKARAYRPGLWPTLILEDRYEGAYSGGAWLAIACYTAYHTDDQSRIAVVEAGAFDGDCECDEFWRAMPEVWWLGKGDTPDAALADLHHRVDERDGCLPVKAKNGVPIEP